MARQHSRSETDQGVQPEQIPHNSSLGEQLRCHRGRGPLLVTGVIGKSGRWGLLLLCCLCSCVCACVCLRVRVFEERKSTAAWWCLLQAYITSHHMCCCRCEVYVVHDSKGEDDEQAIALATLQEWDGRKFEEV